MPIRMTLPTHFSHEPHAQASGLPFFFDVLVRNRIAG